MHIYTLYEIAATRMLMHKILYSQDICFIYLHIAASDHVNDGFDFKMHIGY